MVAYHVTTRHTRSAEHNAVRKRPGSPRTQPPRRQSPATPANPDTKSIDYTHQKRFNALARSLRELQPHFRHSERARRPRNQLNDYGVDNRSDMEGPQRGRPSVTAQPSKAHPHQSRCTNSHDSVRTYAVRMDKYSAIALGTTSIPRQRRSQKNPVIRDRSEPAFSCARVCAGSRSGWTGNLAA